MVGWSRHKYFVGMVEEGRGGEGGEEAPLAAPSGMARPPNFPKDLPIFGDAN